MKFKFKPNTYYKRYYISYKKDSTQTYSILYTDDKCLYEIAFCSENKLLHKFNTKYVWGNIDYLQYHMNINKPNIEELSKEDVFLELL